MTVPAPSERPLEKVTVRITGPGIELEREIDVALLPQLTAFLFSGQSLLSPPTPGLHTERATSASLSHMEGGLERPTSVVEYIREKRPQTSSDTILVLAGFLELFEEQRPFSREDLRRLVRAARLPEPANFPRDVGVAVAKGYIQPLEDGFQLTGSGLNLVTQPGPLVVPRGRGGLRRRRLLSDRSQDEG